MYFRQIALAFSTEIFEGCELIWLRSNGPNINFVGQPFLVAAHEKRQAGAPALQSGLRFNQHGLAALVSPGVAAHRLLFR